MQLVVEFAFTGARRLHLVLPPFIIMFSFPYSRVGLLITDERYSFNRLCALRLLHHREPDSQRWHARFLYLHPGWERCGNFIHSPQSISATVSAYDYNITPVLIDRIPRTFVLLV
jgi:hypothetical protein